jgi:hypothetical protein
MRHAIVASLLVLLAAPAVAQTAGGDPRAAAKKAWRQGAAHYEAGRYPRAIEKFKQSYDLSPSPNTLFSLGQAYRKNGDDVSAIDCFRRYLKDRVDAPNRELVEELIREIEERNPSLRLPETAIASNAATSVPAPAPATEPRPAAPPPPPPPPVDDPAPAETAPPPPPEAFGGAPAPARGWTKDTLGLSLLIGGVVATGVGGTLIVVSGGKSDDARGTVDETDAVDRNASAQTLRTVGVVSTAVGVAAIGAGIVKLWVLPRSSARSSKERSVAWSIVPGGLLVSGSF